MTEFHFFMFYSDFYNFSNENQKLFKIMFFLGKVVFDNIFPSLYDLHVNVPSALGQTWLFETPITLTLIG